MSLFDPPHNDKKTAAIKTSAMTICHNARSGTLDAMVAQPILIERALVVTPNGVRLGRSFTRVHGIL